MTNQLRTQDVVVSFPTSKKNKTAQGVLAPWGFCRDRCHDPETDEPFADSSTPDTCRFVGARIEAAIDELRRLDPQRRHAVWLAIEGLRELREELGELGL